jgi:aspartate racemase
MKRLGIIGGMSWESSAEYYRLINEGIRERLGKLHSAELLLYSVDFQGYEELQHAGEWEDIGRRLGAIASALETAGAEIVMLATNTMHKVAPAIESALSVPFIHIADAAGAAIQSRGLARVGLLGTAFTMEQDFYHRRLADGYGVEVLVPAEADRKLIHEVIYGELCVGQCREDSRREFVRICGDLADSGAQGIVLGCTEIPLLIGQQHVSLPVFDTSSIHCAAAVSAVVGD